MRLFETILSGMSHEPGKSHIVMTSGEQLFVKLVNWGPLYKTLTPFDEGEVKA